MLFNLKDKNDLRFGWRKIQLSRGWLGALCPIDSPWKCKALWKLNCNAHMIYCFLKLRCQWVRDFLRNWVFLARASLGRRGKGILQLKGGNKQFQVFWPREWKIFTVVCHKLGTIFHILLLFSANYCGQTVRYISMRPTAFKNSIFLLFMLNFSDF